MTNFVVFEQIKYERNFTILVNEGASGICEIPEGYVNPLMLHSTSEIEPLIPAEVTTPHPVIYNHTNYVRRKRDTEKVVNTRTFIKDGRRHQIVSMVRI